MPFSRLKKVLTACLRGSVRFISLFILSHTVYEAMKRAACLFHSCIHPEFVEILG